jgi:superfamily II DNA or RNA helicase
MVELREHQNQAHNATTDAIEDGKSRIILEMATGTGKSFTQAALLEYGIVSSEDVTTQVVFVPSQDLVSQNAESYRAYFEGVGIDANIIGVFSPSETSMREGCDSVTTSGEDLYEMSQSGKHNVIIATYASSQAVSDACLREENGERVGLDITRILADEAHRMASTKEVEDAGSWTRPLFDDLIPAASRVFYTATMRTDGPDEETDKIAMNNPDLFGEKVYELGYEEAVARGILKQYVPFPVEIERASIESAMIEAGIEREESETDGSWRNKERAFAVALMSQTALDNRREAGEPLSMMVLHPNRKTAESFTQTFQDEMTLRGEDIACLTVHGAAKEEKERALNIGRTLEGEMVCSVVDMFREGTDMPGLNTLNVGRDAKSTILLVQAMGRVVRQYSSDWADENGNLPNKTPQIYVPVIIDSRDPNSIPDCGLASSLFSAMLIMDDGTRKKFEKACSFEGREEIDGKETKELSATDDIIATAFKMDKNAPSTKMIIQAMAQEARSKETIGQFDRMATMYEGYLEKNNFKAPSLPGRAEYKNATPSDKKALETRKVLTLWHQSVLTKHAARRLLPEEAKRVHEIKGFGFNELKADPNKLADHFEAFKHYTGKSAEGPLKSPNALPENRLARFVKEAGMLAMQGERFDMRGKVLKSEAGDKNLIEFAKVLEMRSAVRGELVPFLNSTDETPVNLKVSVGIVEDPSTGRSQRCLIPLQGEKVPGSPSQARFLQPRLPMSALVGEQKEMFSQAKIGQEFKVSLKMGGKSTLDILKVDPVLGEDRPMSPRWDSLARVMESQSPDFKYTKEDIKGREVASPVGASSVVGWGSKTNQDLINEVSSLRTVYAQGSLDEQSRHRFDRMAGFAWVTSSDFGKSIKKDGKSVSQVSSAFNEFLKHHPEKAIDRSVLLKDDGISNTVRAGQYVVEQTRTMRTLAKDSASGKTIMSHHNNIVKTIIAPNADAFKVWGRWLDYDKVAPVQKETVERKEEKRYQAR